MLQPHFLTSKKPKLRQTFSPKTSAEPMSFSNEAATIFLVKFRSFSMADVVIETRFALLNVFLCKISRFQLSKKSKNKKCEQKLQQTKQKKKGAVTKEKRKNIPEPGYLLHISE